MIRRKIAGLSLFIGALKPLPESGRLTGMYKEAVQGEVEVGLEGFVGDHQADRRVHGGPEKAVHLYPARHYVQLSKQFPDAERNLVPGSMGENISVPDIDERDVRIGEIWKFGSVLLQVCQPRSPCWKIDERFSVDGMAAFIAEQRLTGWYWRVVKVGHVRSEDGMQLEVPAPEAHTLDEALRLVQLHRPDLGELKKLATTPGIAVSWKQKIEQRLEWLRKN